MFSVAEIFNLQSETERFAAERSARRVGQMRGAHGVELMVRVSCTSGVVGVAFFGEAGGGSSGLSGCGAVVGGT